MAPSFARERLAALSFQTGTPFLRGVLGVLEFERVLGFRLRGLGFRLRGCLGFGVGVGGFRVEGFRWLGFLGGSRG